MNDPEAPASQTLSRGVRLLELVAEAGPLTIDALAERLGAHRSVVYRLLRTLEDHGLLVRDPGGRVQLGPRLATLAAGVARDLQSEALPELTAAANELGMTCFVAVLDHEECVTLVSVEPRHAVAVAQRPGSRHAVTLGAPGKAILTQLSRRGHPDDPQLDAEVETARARGWAASHDEVLPGLSAVAVPLATRGQPPAALAAVYLSTELSPETIGGRLGAARDAIVRGLDGVRPGV